MGAQGGILSRQGSEVDPAILATLSSLQTQIGPDGEKLITDRGLACVFRPLIIERGRCSEQPFRAPNGDFVIWNGRLDNESDLRRELGTVSHGAELRRAVLHGEDPVEALVLRAFERWGRGALPRLIGDFSLAYWQSEQRRLLLATDVWALRPVFYHEAGDRLVWASRCRALLDALDLPIEPDPHFIASVLIRPLPGENSPFARLRQIPAAHCLIADAAGVRLERYWAPDPEREIRYRADEEYEEHYRELLRQAVDCRAAATGPVFAELSGGYDSSSISCLADEAIRRGRVATPDLVTVSYVFDDAPSSDERRFIAPVEEKMARPALHVVNEKAPLLTIPPHNEDFRPDFPSGQLIYFERNRAVAERMAEEGSRVLLRGMGGDQVTWSDAGLAPWEISDHLVGGRWRQAVRASQAWSLQLKTPLYLTLWRGGLWPLMPRAIRSRSFGFALPVEGWFEPNFVSGLDLRRFAIGREDDVGFARPSRRLQFAAIREVATLVGWEFLTPRRTVDCRFPFLDRRLVEFALATPVERMLRPGENRIMARRAMRGILPEKVEKRRSKAGPDEAVYRTIARRFKEMSALLRDPLMAQYGFVDRDAFRTKLAQVKHGATTVAPQLTRTFALEFWLRSLHCRQYIDSERSSHPPVRADQPQTPIPSGKGDPK